MDLTRIPSASDEIAKVPMWFHLFFEINNSLIVLKRAHCEELCVNLLLLFIFIFRL